MIPVYKSTDLEAKVASFEVPQVVDKQLFLNKEHAILSRYEMGRTLAQGLAQTEYHQHLAAKVLNCHTEFHLFRCDQNHTWGKAANSCGVRLCPHCAHQKAATVGETVKGHIVGKTNLRYVVLSERNSKNLKQGVDSLYAAWDRLRRSVFWKRHVVGCIAVLEVTYSEKRKDWHPHLNILMEGEYIPFQQLKLKWMKATQDRGRSTHIQKADEGTVAELLKYTLKVAEYRDGGEGRVLQFLFSDPRVLEEFLSVMYGVRAIRTYGSFRKMGDVEKEEAKCDTCGSTCFVQYGRAHVSQMMFDFEKEVFRPAQTLEISARDWLDPTEFDPVFLNFEIRQQKVGIAVASEARQRMRRYERAVAEKFAA